MEKLSSAEQRTSLHTINGAAFGPNQGAASRASFWDFVIPYSMVLVHIAIMTMVLRDLRWPI
jgi:hypothetical protein